MVTGRPAESAAMPILFLLSGPKIGFFALQERHVAPINVKYGTGELPVPVPLFQISHLSGRNVKMQPPKNMAINLPLRGDLFALFVRNSQGLYALQVVFKFLV